ncbi:MAG: molybdenum cofactor biosynthesis protein MoaE [Tissierellaceae bacterium]
MSDKESPSMDRWIEEAKNDPNAGQVGMYLFHNGVVRETPRAYVREGIDRGALVKGMEFSYDEEKVQKAIEEAYKLQGVYYVKVWLNQGILSLGDDIMYVLIGGDIRPNVIDALQTLVEKIKTQCVVEKEL